MLDQFYIKQFEQCEKMWTSFGHFNLPKFIDSGIFYFDQSNLLKEDFLIDLYISE